MWLQNKTGTCMFKVCNNPNLCNKHNISAFWLRSDGTSISKNILWSTGDTRAWYVLFDFHSIFILPSCLMKSLFSKFSYIYYNWLFLLNHFCFLQTASWLLRWSTQCMQLLSIKMHLPIIYILLLEIHNHPRRMFFLLCARRKKETEKQIREAT